MPLTMTLKEGSNFYVDGDPVHIEAVSTSFFVMVTSDGAKTEVHDDVMTPLPTNEEVLVGKGKPKHKDRKFYVRVLVEAPRYIIINRGKIPLHVLPEVIAAAKRLGVTGDIESQIQNMVRLAIPYTGHRLANLRYKNLILYEDSGEVTYIAPYEEKDHQRSKNKGICPDCRGCGGFCLTCNDGTLQP